LGRGFFAWLWFAVLPAPTTTTTNSPGPPARPFVFVVAALPQEGQEDDPDGGDD